MFKILQRISTACFSIKAGLQAAIYLLFLHTLHSQDFSRMQFEIEWQGNTLKNPFAGGLKAPQFSNIDFNQDGKNDLFVFDRSGDVVLPFVKTGQKGERTFAYAPEYAGQFPKLENWAFLRDYNKDGIEDIFSSSTVYPGCIEVWKGYRQPDGKLGFRRITFDYGIPEILQFLSAGQYVNIYCSNIDLPAVEDIDGDGDMDILSFDPDGTFASYFKNTSVEEGLGMDSLKFVRSDLCWGKFAENQFNESINLSNDPNTCAQGITQGGNAGSRHSGSTLCLLDMDGDDDKDLLIGDLASSRMKLLKNGGTSEKAYVNFIETNFPAADIPVYLDIFLSAYYADTDDDGKRDLIVCPNDPGNGETQDHIWLYKNTGTDKQPTFALVSRQFLIDEMLFVNSGSHPAFCDINQDGLADMLIGTNGMLLKDGLRKNRMVLFLNTGTATEPVYSLSDEDFLTMSAKGENTGRLAPAFGDVDNDGDTDLLVGDSFGQLYYFANTAGRGNPYSFAPPVYPYFDIFIGQNAKPAVMDLTMDGLSDLVVGEKNNQLNLFVNTGSKGNPLFASNPSLAPNTVQFGKLFPGNDFFTQNGSPSLILTETGLLLVLGTEAAALFTYNGIDQNTYGSFQLQSHPTGIIQEGRKMTPALHDLDDDGYYEMAIGNERGGVAFYNTPYRLKSTGSDDLETLSASLIVWPNPSTGTLYIQGDVSSSFLLRNQEGIQITSLRPGWNDISLLPSGLYYVQQVGHTATKVCKVILLNNK